MIYGFVHEPGPIFRMGPGNEATRTEYGIKAMSTKHAQGTCYVYMWEVSSLAPSCTQVGLSSPKYICDQVAQAMLN